MGSCHCGAGSSPATSTTIIIITIKHFIIMEALNTPSEIQKHLDAIVGKLFTYCNKKQAIAKYEINQQREVVIVYFTLSDPKRLTFDDVHGFLNRVWRDLENESNTELVPQQPMHIQPTGKVKDDIDSALKLSDTAFDKCIESLMAELDGAVDLTDPKVKERILLKTKVTDAIIKVEVAKTSRGSVMAKLIRH